MTSEMPSDPIDQASEVTEALTNAAIENARQASKGREIRPIGVCHNCQDPLDMEGQLFCDEYCAEDYEYVQRRRKANRA